MALSACCSGNPAGNYEEPCRKRAASRIESEQENSMKQEDVLRRAGLCKAADVRAPVARVIRNVAGERRESGKIARGILRRRRALPRTAGHKHATTFLAAPALPVAVVLVAGAPTVAMMPIAVMIAMRRTTGRFCAIRADPRAARAVFVMRAASEHGMHKQCGNRKVAEDTQLRLPFRQKCPLVYFIFHLTGSRPTGSMPRLAAEYAVCRSSLVGQRHFDANYWKYKLEAQASG